MIHVIAEMLLIMSEHSAPADHLQANGMRYFSYCPILHGNHSILSINYYWGR